MADILVVYFSRTGACEAVARVLADRLGADLDVVRPAQSYRGTIGFLKGVVHAIRRTAPPVTSLKAPGNYALVVIGAPVWAGGIAAPMRSYLARHGAEMRMMAAFSVSARGGRFDRFFLEAEEIAGRRPAATLALSQAVASTGSYSPEFEPFLRAVREHVAGAHREIASG